MATPALGDTVHVWPALGDRVRSHDPAIVNRYLPPEGADLPWTPWLQERFHEGHVTLSDPRPSAKPAPVTPAPKAKE